MTEARTPEDRLRGILRITVGGVEKKVLTLPMRAALEWWEKTGAPTIRELPEREGELTQLEFVSDLNALGLEITMDLVVAYDREAALGGREWLEGNANPQELNAALHLMLDNVFPFAEDVSVILAALVAQTVVKSRSQSSTNGPLPIGALPQDHLKRRSTRRS